MHTSPGLHTSQEGFWSIPLYRSSLNPKGFLAVALQLKVAAHPTDFQWA